MERNIFSRKQNRWLTAGSIGRRPPQFSFYPGKKPGCVCGEAGAAVTTNDPAIAAQNSA